MRPEHRGRWQAQGEDMQPSEHSVPWAQHASPTQAEGLAALAELAEKCDPHQRRRRTAACDRAKAWVRDATMDGHPPVKRSFVVRPPAHNAKGARIDVEVIAGRAFGN